MKAFITTALLLALAIFPLTILADSDTDGHNLSVDDVVSDILADQSVNNIDDVNCDQVTDNQFNELGDAVMQMMVGDSRQHEAMDNMMGGEGSDSLRVMYIGMGQRYLGCASDDSGSFGMGQMGMMGGMMSMMGGAMNMMGSPLGMGTFRGGDDTMMGNFGSWGMTGIGGAGMLLFWIVVIVGIVLLVKWLSGQQSIKTKEKSALDILKERYAKGEINKQEFEDKKKDIS